MNKVGVGREGVEKSGGKGVAGMVRLEWEGLVGGKKCTGWKYSSGEGRSGRNGRDG